MVMIDAIPVDLVVVVVHLNGSDAAHAADNDDDDGDDDGGDDDDGHVHGLLLPHYDRYNVQFLAGESPRLLEAGRVQVSAHLRRASSCLSSQRSRGQVRAVGIFLYTHTYKVGVAESRVPTQARIVESTVSTPG